MKKTSLLPVMICLGMSLAIINADELADNAKTKVQPAVPLKVHAFPLEEVRVLDGPFKHAMELDEAYLLALDVDRLLHNFRLNAGLPSSAQPLGGWEEPKGELRGHFVGHISPPALSCMPAPATRASRKRAMLSSLALPTARKKSALGISAP